MNSRKHPLLPYISVGFALYLVLIAIVGYFFFDRFEREKSLYLQNRLETTDAQIESIKLAYDTVAKTIFETSINTPYVSAMMAQAAKGDLAVQNKVRQELYSHLSSLYLELEEHNVRQLHFHLPGSISFLRFHRPNKFGDSLVGIRPAIDAVNRDQRSVNGFEEGRIFNGFRHVFPLFHQGQFVGSVELSYSFDAIKELARKIHPARYEMILKKGVIDEKVFKEEKFNYSTSTLNTRYVWDNHLQKTYDPIISQSVIEEINTLAAKEFEKIDRDGAHSIIPIVVQEKGYLLWFDPLLSFDRKEVGYILGYMADQHLMELKREFRVVMMIVSLIIAFLTVMIVYFIYQIRTQHHLLVKNANTDRLTQIANRAYLILQLDYMLKASRRNGHPLSVIFMDIDHFKEINDTYGHRMGDYVLVEMSSLIKERLRESDIVGRWGGEEFVMILPNTGLNEAIMLAEKLRVMIDSHRFDHGNATCSFGVAQMIEDDTEETLIHRADAMLYVAKEHGRNRVRPKAA